MKFYELKRYLAGARLLPCGTTRFPELTSATADPDAADAGAIFVCTRTALKDGQYLTERAYRHGCRVFVARHDPALPGDAAVFIIEETEPILAALAAKFCGHPAREMTVLGVCGTAGKTTAILFAEAMLHAQGRRVGILTPHLCRCEGLCLPGKDIHPDAAETQHILGLFREHDCDTVLIECGSYQLLHHTFDVIPFAAVALTRYDYNDLEPGGHRTEAECLGAIAALLEDAKQCFLPVGETHFPKAAHPKYFGINGELALHTCAEIQSEDRPARELLLSVGRERGTAILPAPADLLIPDALAALSLCHSLGYPLDSLCKTLSGTRPVSTLEHIGSHAGGHIYRDSAYSPVALRRAISALRPLCRGHLSVLFGSVGGRAKRRRAPLAQAAASADMLYLTADDPGREDPAKICGELANYLPYGVRFRIIPDRTEAIETAISELSKGDALLLAGKGLCPTHCVMFQRFRYDERLLVERLLAKQPADRDEQ